MRKTRQILGLTVAALFGTVARLDAQPNIDFHGFAAGCFTWTAGAAAQASAGQTGAITTACTEPTGGAVVPGGGGAGGATLVTDVTNGGTLRYDDDSFWGTTSGIGPSLFAGINNPADGGSFGLLTTTGTFDANLFTNLSLVMKFYFNTDLTLITGSTGTPTGAGPFYTATLTGKVVNKKGGNGGVEYTFDPSGVSFAFTGGGHLDSCNQTDDACGAGPFSGIATIIGSSNSVNFSTSGTSTQNVTGRIFVVTASPEPASIALFATGLAGMIPVVRYSRRKRA